MASHWRVCASCIVAFLLITSCETTRSSQDGADPAGSSAPKTPVIHFLTLNIHKAAGSETARVSLLNHKTAEGVLKKQPDWNSPPSLTCYLYQEKHLIDSLSIEHPLYKHLEYPTSETSMGSKDTVIGSADFTIRFQTKTPVNEIRIMETLRTKASHPLSIIKL